MSDNIIVYLRILTLCCYQVVIEVAITPSLRRVMYTVFVHCLTNLLSQSSRTYAHAPHNIYGPKADIPVFLIFDMVVNI